MISPSSPSSPRVTPSASSGSPAPAAAAAPEPAPAPQPKSSPDSFQSEFDLSKSAYYAAKLGGPEAEAAPSGAPVVSVQNGRTHVQLGASNDQVNIAQRADGGMDVSVNGRVTSLTPEQVRAGVTVDCGAGDDRVQVANGVTADLEVHGGAGDDTLIGGDGADKLFGGAGNDTLTGGAGNDVLDGGDGHDYLEGGAGNDVMRGGDGKDVMYGLDGDDQMDGGGGDDYMDGGAGNDRVNGGAGNDALFGGQGDDALEGGAGNDVLAGGSGRDTLNGGAGTDQLFSQAEDTIQNAEGDTNTRVDMSRNVGTSVSVTGSADFQTRVQSDLEAMRSIPTGREMLQGLDASGKRVNITQTEGGNAARPERREDATLRPDGSAGPGTNGTVMYHPTRSLLDTSEDWMIRPPMIGLFHELVHATQYATGTLPTGTTRVDGPPGGGWGGPVANSELDAVGLPWDHDADPSTPPRVNPRVNENQLRRELGLPLRPHY